MGVVFPNLAVLVGMRRNRSVAFEMGGLKKFSLVFGLIGCIFNFLFFNRRIPFIVKILTL